MKILLSTLNAKYIHSNLAIRYLQSYCREEFPNIKLREFTINDHSEAVVGEIYKEEPSILAFSCYIWNITETLEIAAIFKKVSPKTLIILGGPEVSYDPLEILEGNNFVDYVIYGEGEETFNELLHFLIRGIGNVNSISGLAYRENQQIHNNPKRNLIEDLNLIPFPYEEELEESKNKIIYYESSRGCPFQCQYCLSSTVEGVRFFSVDRVKMDLLGFIQAGVKQVKFVDRTFNCNKKRTLEIMQFIVCQGGKTNFHFELAADLLDDELLDFLANVPKGIFQFEIGVQSTNVNTLSIIQRKMDLAKVKENVLKIENFGNIHQHLDLIAGLPDESYDSFKKSFNEVCAMKPDVLQLGFLKMLKGSGIRETAEQFDYIYNSQPPYEVLANKDISYDEILKLKMIEDLLEKYGNSQRFKYSLAFLKNGFSSYFDMYEALADYWEEKGYHRLSHSSKSLYEIIYDFYICKVVNNYEVFSELLMFDYLLHNKGIGFLSFVNRKEQPSFNEACWDFLKDNNNLVKYLPHYQGLAPKQIIKTVHFEQFNFEVARVALENKPIDFIEPCKTIIIFDYHRKDTATFNVLNSS